MAVVRSSQRFNEAVKKNKKLRKMRGMLERGAYAIDITQVIRELESLHSTRKFRSYEVKEVVSSMQKKLMEATVENSSFRSRCVELKMRCFKVSRLLEEHLGIMRDYLATKYADVLRNEFNTIKDRNAAVNTVLTDFTRLQHKLETAIKLADMVINDMDQAYWSIQLVERTMELNLARKERNI